MATVAWFSALSLDAEKAKKPAAKKKKERVWLASSSDGSCKLYGADGDALEDGASSTPHEEPGPGVVLWMCVRNAWHRGLISPLPCCMVEQVAGPLCGSEGPA